MSPLTVRRYRAERLLRKEFEGLRGRVMGMVRGRLRASGVSLDGSDLEACYAQAWQGLYTAMLAGEEIANPTGWLTLVTFRRAIEEHRSRRRAYPSRGAEELSDGLSDGLSGGREADLLGGAREHDFAGSLDDRIRLRQVFEGLRGRLSAREQQAAALCYLQGLSRSEAATRMGISESRMRKLMEGPGAGRPGVAGKVGELVETIRAGGWCEEQGSLMRGFAFGILDPDGERYRLALAHRRECPACRAYVLSLRGLAAVLPPTSLPLALGAGAVLGAGGAGATGVGASAGAAGVGSAAGGGWVLAGGPVGAKLALGCLLALSVGAGCVALTVGPDHARRLAHRPEHPPSTRPDARAAVSPPGASYRVATGAPGAPRAAVARSSQPTPALTSAGRASREFGPERAFTRTPSSSTPAPVSSTSSPAGAPGAPSARAASGGQSASRSSAAGTSTGGKAAQREFGIG
jgi:RNA polymerase sigma factor (sigma-70 family)